VQVEATGYVVLALASDLIFYGEGSAVAIYRESTPVGQLVTNEARVSAVRSFEHRATFGLRP
jgi:hypothetical protein